MTQYACSPYLLRKLLVAGLILLATLGGAVYAAPARHAPAQAQAQERSLDLVLLVDESGSAWGRTDPDPDPQHPGQGLPPFRIRAAQLLVDLLSVEQGLTHPDHRVAVYFFGTQVAEVIPLQSVAGHAAEITKKIQDDHYKLGNLKWTDTVAAFSKADNILRAQLPNLTRRAVVVMITDGRPETEQANIQDGDNTPAAQQLESYLKQNASMIQSIASVPNSTGNCKSLPSAHPIYLLAVDTEATIAYAGTRYVSPEFSNYWSQPNLIGNQYHPVPDFEALSGQVSLLVAELLCAVGEPPTAQIPLPTVRSFDIHQNYTSVIFTIINSDSHTQASVVPPGGSPLLPNSPGVKVVQGAASQVWSVSRDQFTGTWGGKWNVKVDGTGTVQFTFIQFSDSYSVRLLQPTDELHPAGKPLDVQGQVVNNDSEPYTQPAQAFDLNAVRTASDGSQTPISQPMAHNDDASYQTRIDRPKPGRYTLNLVADLGNNQVAKLAPARTVSVEKLPYLVLVEPRDGTPLFTGNQFAVSISARSMGENDDQPRPIDEIVAHRTTISATLRNQSDGSTVEQAPLVVQTDGTGVTHAAQLPSPPAPGTYNLVIRLEYPLKDQTFSDVFTRTITFQAKDVTDSPTVPPITVTPTPPPPVCPDDPRCPGGDPMLFILSVLGLAAAGGGGSWWWLTAGRMGTLSGSWLDTSSGLVSLSGRGHKLDLYDSSSIKQGQVKLWRDKSGQAYAQVLRLTSGQNLTIGGSSLNRGDVVPLNHGESLNLDGQTWTFNQP